MISTRGLYSERSLYDGVQRLYRFENGYGASVVRHQGSYGGPKGLWEIAVIKWADQYERTDADWYLCYSTPITEDVIGYLKEDQVNTILSFIEKLNMFGNFTSDEDAQAWEKFSNEL